MQLRKESLKKFNRDICNIGARREGRGGGGRVLPSSRLMGMYRWMGSHFHDCIDHYVSGCIFIRVTRMASHNFRILGVRKFSSSGI